MCPLNKSYKTPHNRIKILTKEATKMVNGPYWCPNCRKERLQILADPNKKAVYATCACGLEEQLNYAPVFQPCDYYSKFMDTYRKKQRQQPQQAKPSKK
jgi:transcription elongation factor Elf1